MGTIVDAKGLPCPQPVMKTKKALDTDNDITVIVDNETAASNVRMFSQSRGCEVEIIPNGDAEFHIHIRSTGKIAESDKIPVPETYTCKPGEAGNRSVMVFSSNVMGRGDDQLGEILMKAFIHTVTEMENPPSVVILYNTGVKLAGKGSSTADDLNVISSKGAKVLVCGTCVKYFKLENDLGVGTISNMYDIVSILSTASGIVTP